METNLAVDSVLLEQALQLSGLASDNVISLFNTVEYDENYDYKKLRGYELK